METKEITLTAEQIDAMSPQALGELLAKAVKVEGTGVVLRADGTIKYDDPATRGQYNEEAIS